MKASKTTLPTEKNSFTSRSVSFLSRRETALANVSQWPDCPVDLGPSRMNSTTAFCSTVRLVFTAMHSSTSFFSCSDPTCGGGPGRNWSLRSSANGLTRYQWGVRKPITILPPLPLSKGIGWQQLGCVMGAGPVLFPHLKKVQSEYGLPFEPTSSPSWFEPS